MGDIRFTPHFQHTDWADGTDRVRAKDPNGFNTRFATIESDLVQFSTVVAQIDTALDQAANRPTQQQLWLPPQFDREGGGWSTTPTGAVTAHPRENLSGVMGVVLPDGVRLLTFRVIGQASTNVQVKFQLSRVPFRRSDPQQVLATFTGVANSFDVLVDVNPDQAQTATASFRYMIEASCANGMPDPGFGVTATIATFQIVYSTN